MRDNDLWIRLGLGAPCVLLAIVMMATADDPQITMLLVFPCLLAFALIIFPSTTDEAGRFWAQMYAPHEDARPRPALAAAQTLRARGLAAQALAAYRPVLRKFPTDLSLWNTCFEIAWVELADREVATEFHVLALRVNEDPEIWRQLNHLYRMQAERHPDFALWEEDEAALIRRRTRARERMPAR